LHPASLAEQKANSHWGGRQPRATLVFCSADTHQHSKIRSGWKRPGGRKTTPPHARFCGACGGRIDARNASPIAVPVPLGDVLLHLAELPLDLALHLLRTALDVLVTIVERVADTATDFALELFCRALDAVANALTVQVFAIGHGASGAAVMRPAVCRAHRREVQPPCPATSPAPCPC